MSSDVRKPSSGVHFAAGLATGVLSAALLQPADLLKTRLQQSHAQSLPATLRAIASSPGPLAQLWRGTLPSVLRTGFGSALYFSSLSWLRAALASSPPHSRSAAWGAAASSSTLPRLSPGLNLAAGAAARTFAGMVLMPLTVLKVRMESSRYGYASLVGAARETLRAEGARGFFAGVGATALRDAPYAGLYVLFYEAGKARWGSLAEGYVRRARTEVATAGGGTAAAAPAGISPTGRGGGGTTQLLPAGVAAGVNFAAGVGAAAGATALTNPFDAVKTRLQLEPRKYGNLVRGASMLVRQEGWRALFDGLGLRMARKALSSAIAWTLYEELVRLAQSRMER